jgi:hypothetical protein
MILTYHGGDFFKVSFGNTTIAYNPPSKQSSLKTSRFGADLALVSLEHPDMNGVDSISSTEKEPFSIRGPGAYEVRDVLIKGYASSSHYGGHECINTIYLVTLEKMNLLFLGALNNPTLPPELKEALDEIDILFVPVGGNGTLTPKEAHALSVAIEPKMIIPTHHWSDVRTLETFLKEIGALDAPRTDKLTIKPRDLDGKENDVVVFTS